MSRSYRPNSRLAPPIYGPLAIKTDLWVVLLVKIRLAAPLTVWGDIHSLLISSSPLRIAYASTKSNTVKLQPFTRLESL